MSFWSKSRIEHVICGGAHDEGGWFAKIIGFHGTVHRTEYPVLLASASSSVRFARRVTCSS